MRYLGREISRRHLAVVTFVLISFLISGKLVRARPQENFVVASSQDSGSKSNVNRSDGAGGSSEIKEVVTEKTDPEIATVESDNRNEVHANDVVETKSTTPEIVRSVTGTPVKFFAEYSVNSALDFGRAAAESSTKPPSTSVNTLKPFNKHLLPASASDMMVTDVRTPPKIKSQISHSHAMQSMSTPGKGEAIPVVLDGNEEAALEKISSDNFKYTHSDATPVSGLSTWILLNSDAISTPFSHKKVHKPVLYDVTNLTSTENSTADVKRKQKPNASSTTTTENSIKSKIDAVVMKKPDRKPIATIQKVNQTHAKKPVTPKIDPDVIQTTTGVSLQDSKFKNKTPVIMGKVPVTTAKMEQIVNSTTPTVPIFLDAPVDNGTRLGTPVVTYPHVPVRQRPSSSTTRKPFISTTRPAVSQPSPNSPPQRISSTPVELTVISTSSPSTEATSPTSTEDSITEISSTETTTKKTTSSKKKKKKNKKKNKRRRPSTNKKPARVQSKISEDDNSTSKLPNTGLATTSRPLSTRIYNYLAREVMPNVGVGLVGLVLTAGLAGLLLYPFGAAVPIRRNYEKPNHPSYNLNDYPPINEVDNAQPEESVLSQVLAGMSNTMNQYSREQPDLVYKNPPKYKPARFDPPNTFTHLKEVKFTTDKSVDDTGKYSELGDVVSGPHESVKFTSFDINDSIKYPMESAQPSPSYPTLDLTTSSQNDPMPYHKYKGTVSNSQPGTIVKPESTYSTLGEYSSYNNPNELIQSPVYTGESYDYKNHKQDQDMQEFKVSSDLEVVTQISENQTTTSSPTTTVSTVKPVRHEQPSFAALEGIPKNYRTLQTSIRFEEPASVLPMNQDFVPSDGMGVYATSIEHGPRSLRFRRRKRNVSSENELDSVLMDQQHASENTTSETKTPRPQVTTTPTEKMTSTESEKVTTTLMYNHSAVNSSDFSNDIFDDVKVEASTESNAATTTTMTSAMVDSSSTTAAENSMNATTEKSKDEVTGSYQATCENCDLVNVEEPSPPTQTFSLSTLLRKLLNFKLRLGLELIRATSEVIGRYLGTVQARMTEALRNIQRSAFRTANNDNRNNKKVIKRRDRRQTKLIFDKLD